MSEDILEALETALLAGEGVGPIVGAFYGLAETADAATRESMLAALDRPLRSHPLDRVGPVGILAGALVELGADPHKFPTAVFDRILEQWEAIEEDSDVEHPHGFYELQQGAMACLARSPELRRTLPQKPRLLAAMRRYQERYSFMAKMIQLLDDEPLLVVHPSTGRGFRFRMHGIADNFQLHLLLLGALAGDGAQRIEGRVPSAEALAAASDGAEVSEASVTSTWQLVQWHGLRAGGEIERVDYDRTWIWNEGVPRDIAPFEGARVVLIGPTTIERSWNAQRVFPGMAGRLDGPVVLPRDEVRSLVARMDEARSRQDH